MAAEEDEDEMLVLLQQEISQLQQDATKLQEEYNSIRSCETLPQNPEHVAKHVIKRKLYLIKAELEVLKQTEVKVLPESSALWNECLKQELMKSVKELKATASDMKTEKKELESKIQSVQESLDREIELQRTLNKKLKELSNIPASSKESQYKAATSRSKKVHAHLDNLSKEMNHFISVHFPPPSAEEIDQQTEGLPLNTSTSQDLLSMTEIVQKLISQWTLSPNSPYVSSETFWPPYLELVLRLGIAQRHTHDPNLVRLQDFR